MEPIEAYVKMTEKEYVSLCFKTQVTGRNGIIIVLAVAIIIISAVIQTSIFTKNDGAIIPGFWQGFPNMIVFLAFLPVSLYISAKKYQNSYAAIKEGYNCVITETGLKIINNVILTDLIWKGIYKVDRMKGMFVLYPTDRTMYFIPDKALKKFDSVEKVKKLLTAKIDKKKRNWK